MQWKTYFIASVIRARAANFWVGGAKDARVSFSQQGMGLRHAQLDKFFLPKKRGGLKPPPPHFLVPSYSSDYYETEA